MNTNSHSNVARVLLVGCALFLTLGAFIYAGEDIAAQPSLPDATPSDIATRLSILSGQPNELELVFVDTDQKKSNSPASSATVGNFFSEEDLSRNHASSVDRECE